MVTVAAGRAARHIVLALLLGLTGAGSGAIAAGDDAGRSSIRFEARFQLAALDPTAPLAPSRPRLAEPFGLMTRPAPGGVVAMRWRSIERDIRAELETVASCRAEPDRCPSPAARKFIAIADTARSREGRARIGEINRAINLAIRPVTDPAQHGTSDVWTSPLKTLESAVGDCEDYAIAKFAALREAGIDEADLRILVVQEPGAPFGHAVASVRLDGRWLILDNRRLVMIEDNSLNARPLLVLQAGGAKAFTSRPLGPPAVTAAFAGPDGAQGHGGFGAAPLVM